MRRLVLMPVVLLLIGIGLAACGDDDDSSSATTTTAAAETTTTTASADTTTTTAAASGGETLSTATTSLGEVLVDANGMTVYLFMNDTAGTSTCVDQCADTWPAVAVDGTPTVGGGADDSKVATTDRADGTTQVTYNGHPLYTFSGDAAPGDTNGQGIGEVWFAVTPDGEAASA
jgi:predicted lipoprotein with Yx(FWY)xxD motif